MHKLTVVAWHLRPGAHTASGQHLLFPKAVSQQLEQLLSVGHTVGGDVAH